jgi:molecular chaperone GrpE
MTVPAREPSSGASWQSRHDVEPNAGAPQGDAQPAPRPEPDAGAPQGDAQLAARPEPDAPSEVGTPEGGLQVLQEDDESAIDAVRRERDEYLDALRRLQADFENFRKRVHRQQDELRVRAAEQLVTTLLPSLDAFDLAVAHLAGDEKVSPSGLLQAASLLSDTLAKEGLERVDDVGKPFDPTTHEAVEHAPALHGGDGDDANGDDVPGNGAPHGPVVDAVLRPGYRWKGRIIRPAMVKVRG